MAFDSFDDFDLMGLEGQAGAEATPWAWFLNDVKNFGLAFKANPDENMAEKANVQGGESVTVTFEDEQTGDSTVTNVLLFRAPILSIVREVKVAEWTVGSGRNRQKARAVYKGRAINKDPGWESRAAQAQADGVPYTLFDPKTPQNEFKLLKKALCALVSEQGEIISGLFQITLKGVTKMSWSDALYGPQGEIDLFSPQHLAHGKFDVPERQGLEYFGAAPSSKGLHFDKGSRDILLERLRVHTNNPRLFPSKENYDLFWARTLFRPIFNRTQVGTEANKKKPGVIVAGYQAPTQENIGMGFIPKAGIPTMQGFVDFSYEWEKGLTRKPKRPEASQILDCSSWGADWASDVAEEAPATVAASVPAPSGAPWASDDPLF